ncbi:SWIM zinc finger family protein [Rhodococcus sp. TAF43]|uniref:SWIM zinc finger family protein n=1 Tax=unclassified Rhodococcus (in: high G+C Gram-positive bacteria) TaxID=192944 RepID=UPI001583A85C|nr:SWIM zinc finger family protein [Rhodococcus sp. W8901]QKT10982.1 SWIM zinc finger family protein [Rhodococcus sp. W8901]
MSPRDGRPDFRGFGPRLRVVGGVEAQSKRGAFARGWWGRALTEVLERAGDTGRLSRGRTYARGGQVVALHIAPGRVTGEVQGSQIAPFTSVLTLRTLDDDEVAAFVETVRSTPGMLAALASGAVPQELAPMLLPGSSGELDFDCTCPDPGWPCKHVAAVAYLLAERVDHDPLTMLALRGLDLDTLIRSVGGEDEQPPAGADDYFGDGAHLPELPAVEYCAATDDLDPALLRKVLQADTDDPSEVVSALRDLGACYRALGARDPRRR